MAAARGPILLAGRMMGHCLGLAGPAAVAATARSRWWESAARRSEAARLGSGRAGLTACPSTATRRWPLPING